VDGLDERPEYRNTRATDWATIKASGLWAISQDLDLFRMPLSCASIPMEERRETDRVWWQRFSVFGGDVWAAAGFRSIPKTGADNSSDIKLRSSILRGQGLTQQAIWRALLELNKALRGQQNSSLAHYRVAEVFFLRRIIRPRPMRTANR